MRWFDRDYVNGVLSDDEWQERQESFGAHVTRIRPRLTGGAEQLLESVSLHDGQVAEWCYEPGIALTVRVLVGDLQQGYEWLTLSYTNANLSGMTEADLNRWWPVDALATEIIEEEVDIIDDLFEHRMLLWPEGEVGVRFRTLTVERVGATPDDRRGGE